MPVTVTPQNASATLSVSGGPQVTVSAASAVVTVSAVGAQGATGAAGAAGPAGPAGPQGPPGADGAGSSTDLTFSRTATTVTVISSSGLDAVLPASDTLAGGSAGVMTAADRTKLDGIATGATAYVHPAHSGDVTSVGDGATTIAANAVSDTKLRDSAPVSVIGRSANTSGDPADIPAGANNQVLRRAGDALSWAQINAALIAANVITNAKMVQVTAPVIKGRTTAGLGDLEDMTPTQTTALLDTFTTAFKGLAPASGGGTTNFLRADGTWNAPGGGGGGATNLTFSQAATTVTVLSDTGTDAVLPAADGTNAGVFPSASFTKLAGIATGATANDTDANLRARSSHTGTQAISTILAAATARLFGRFTAAGGAGEELTGTQATTLLDNATTSLKGLQSAADKTKLDGVATGATANSSDATLLARANHTGTQAPSTVLFAATARFLGRFTAAGGAGEEVTGTQATTLLDTFGTLKGLVPGTASGTTNYLRADGTWAAPPGTFALANDSVTDAILRNSAALSVIGRSANSTGDPADIAAANDGEVLRRSGTALGFGTVATAGIADDAVTAGKLANMAQNTIKGRVTASTGDPEDLSAANVRTIINVADGANNYTHPNHTGAVTSTGDGATAIAADAVGDTHLRNSAGLSVIGRTGNTTGDPADIVAGTDGHVLTRVGTTLVFAAPAGGGGGANLTFSQTGTTVTVLSDSGTDAILPAADGTNAGVFPSASFTKLAGIATGATANSSDATLLARANHTGTQAPATVTFAAGPVFMGRNTAGAGTGEEITATQATALLNNFSSTLKGLAPLSGGGTTNFLRADGTWVNPAAIDFGYKTGRFYTTMDDGAVTTGAAGVLSIIYLHPFYISESVTVLTLAIHVSTLIAASTAKLAIWSNDATTDRPVGAPVIEFNAGISTAATGSISANVTDTVLTTGWYWAGTKYSTSGVVCRSVGANYRMSRLIGGDTAVQALNGPVSGLTFADTYANNMPTFASGASFTGISTNHSPVFALGT